MLSGGRPGSTVIVLALGYLFQAAKQKMKHSRGTNNVMIYDSDLGTMTTGNGPA